MSEKRSILYLLTTLLVLSMLLISCGKKEVPTEPGEAPEAGEVKEPGEEEVTLKFYSFLNEEEPYVAIYKEIIADFEETYPNTSVDVTWMGRELPTKIRPLLQAGDIPDLIEVDAPMIYAGMVKEGLIGDLTEDLNTPAYNSDKLWKDTFVSDALKMYALEGEVNVIPHWTDVIQIYYDQRLFDEYDLEPAETWDELMEICEVFKENDIPCFGQDGTTNFYNAMWLEMVAARLMDGQALLRAGMDETGEIWREPAYLEAAKKVYSLHENGYFMDGWQGSQYPAAQMDWVNGKTGLFLMYSWLPAETVDAAPDGFVFRSFPFPTVDGKGSPAQLEMWDCGFSVMKDAPHWDEAVTFMKFFTAPENYIKLQEEYGFVSSIKTGAVPAFNSDAQTNIERGTEVVLPEHGLSAEAPDYTSEVYYPLDDRLIFNKITSEEFIDQISEKTVEYWASQ
jgi:raffinose/stachyose/melibiose transport system substrate-binding protein